jgi:cytochrome bd-type quinol oxidase subunit 2
MNDYDFNSGILIGGTVAALSVFAALAALYLWAVNKGRIKPGLLPWVSPLVLPLLVIYCLAIVAVLYKAYEQEQWSWSEAPKIMFMSFVAFMIFVFWLKLRKKVY